MDDREARHLGHPPACTCVDCVNARLRRIRKEVPHPRFHQRSKEERKPIRYKPYKISGWLLTLLFVFALFVGGLGISALLKSAIPLLILLGFFAVYMARKWLLPTVLIILILLAVTSTVSMVGPQGVIRIVPKELEVLHVLPTKIDATTVEKAIFELVNQERVNEGLPLLLLEESLVQYSRKHSSDMAIKRSLYHDKAELAKLHAGENALLISKYQGGFILLPYPIGLALYRSDRELYSESVKSWMDSPGHRLNILTSSYKYTGIGVAIAEDGITCYITQNFR